MTLDTHVYAINDRPGTVLVIGIPNGEQRPAMWLQVEGGPGIILARFYGDKHAQAAINFLDTQIDMIDRVIQYYADKHGDETV